MSKPTSRIVKVVIDERSVIRWSPEIEHERNVAIFDLIEGNSFALKDGPAGPYELMMGLRDSTLVLEVKAYLGEQEILIPVRSLRGVIKDYFLICESYFSAIKGATATRIEALDMARRGLHDEGAKLLADVLETKVSMDAGTARRLFTLICVLHVRS
ncbi:Uncharacterized protein, UPF0262 family [Arboricoccus pini]|uniref:Uncharacterized protein, UPF0262 family n=1 Tax=Arboricoccus pini TaxID=1963835 RepID=A0A212R071_9PROT|nr:UPF0262 family protein [Arboricoccus pini]SNB65359.1 Uncharacterized protein, UPF0262 family [Arboricoccus pini]